MKMDELLPLLLRREARLIAIDGDCCSGKTSLAAYLSAALPATVFHMDDFYLRPEQRTNARLAEPGGNVDYERFLSEVLTPLSEGRAVQLRRYDCHSQRLLPAEEIPPAPRAIIEGSYALHPALRDRYDYRILLQVDPATQRQRLLVREGAEKAERFFSLWLPLEARYFASLDPAQAADAVIDTAGRSLG